MRHHLPRIVLMFVSLLAPWCLAQTASLPLKGYYKPGRYMPVKLEGFARECVVTGDGIVPTDIDAGASRIVPLLPLGTPGDSIRVTAPGVGKVEATPSPRPLPLGERLVAVTSASLEPIATGLFRGEPTIVVVIDPADLSAGGAMAWDTLDGLVGDAAFFGSLDRAKADGLLACGVTLATADAAPDTLGDWTTRGKLRILQKDIVGPSGAIGGETAYLPVGNWTPGPPAHVRRQIVIVAAIVILLFLGCMLLPHRSWVGWALLGVGFVASVAIGAWNAQQPAVRTVSGRIAVTREAQTQVDRWTYAGSRTGGDFERPLRAGAWPVLANDAQAEAQLLRLHVAADSSVSLRGQLEHGARLAVLERQWVPSLRAATDSPYDAASRSPLRELARRLYSTGGFHPGGERAESDADWETVYVLR